MADYQGVDVPNPRRSTGLDLYKQDLNTSRDRMYDPQVTNPCAWDGCGRQSYLEMPICFRHAYVVHRHIDALLTEGVEETPKKRKSNLVYYLMVGPQTVKIGTTGNLLRRVTQLRTDLQYVVAVEHGAFTLEAERHRQFDAERLGKREDFIVSDRLTNHIRSIQAGTYSDELLEMYRDLSSKLASLPPAQRGQFT